MEVATNGELGALGELATLRFSRCSSGQSLILFYFYGQLESIPFHTFIHLSPHFVFQLNLRLIFNGVRYYAVCACFAILLILVAIFAYFRLRIDHVLKFKPARIFRTLCRCHDDLRMIPIRHKSAAFNAYS